MRTFDEWQEADMQDEAKAAHDAGNCRFDTCSLCWAEHEALMSAFMEDDADDEAGDESLAASPSVPLHLDPEAAALFMGEPVHVVKWAAEAKAVYLARKEIEGAVLARQEKAIHLQCEPSGLAEGVWHVTGGTDPDGHTVNLHADWGSVCTCGDHVWNRTVCKHQMRVLLGLGESFSDSWPSWTAHGASFKPGIFTRAVQVDLENAAYKAAKDAHERGRA